MDNCQHQGCTCQVSGGEQFCSDHCREHAEHGDTDHSCECGHPGCGAA